jgi:hypothetical protein
MNTHQSEIKQLAQIIKSIVKFEPLTLTTLASLSNKFIRIELHFSLLKFALCTRTTFNEPAVLRAN